MRTRLKQQHVELIISGYNGKNYLQYVSSMHININDRLQNVTMIAYILQLMSLPNCYGSINFMVMNVILS